MKRGLRLTLAVALAAAPLLLWPATVGAGERDDYLAAVDRANQLVVRAQQGDPTAARQALQVLRATGRPQPEIEADLEKNPPDLADAQARLSALAEALGNPARAPNPPRARGEVNRILAMHRYDALNAQPSILDRVLDAITRELLKFLSNLTFGGIPSDWLLLALVALILVAAGVAALLIRVASRGARGSIAAYRPDLARQLAIDRFALADKLSAEGDFLGAVRALAGGVAVALGGEGAWEASPLTVRELFSRGPSPDELRPLLLLFEAAVYGAQVPTEPQYRQAEAIAARFRPASGREAA